MDLTLSVEQRDLTGSVRSILARWPSKEPNAVYERAAMEALAEAGFLDVMRTGGTALDAVLVIDEAALSGLTAPVAARTLVGPSLTDGELPPALGVADRARDALVRFGGQAGSVLVIDGERARLTTTFDAADQGNRWGYPVARVTATGGEQIGTASALRRAWRIAMAAEAGGLMRAAVDKATRYVTDRFQFGRPIGGYQAVQHRLAGAHVLAEGTRWLARSAAWSPQDDVAAAAAACYACDGMREVFRATQQVVGAMGLTDEFGLTRLTGKLAYLHTELGGARANAKALAAARWFSTAKELTHP